MSTKVNTLNLLLFPGRRKLKMKGKMRFWLTGEQQKSKQAECENRIKIYPKKLGLIQRAKQELLAEDKAAANITILIY